MQTRRKSEKQLLEDYLVDELNKYNIHHIKGNPQGAKGFPDRVIFAHKIIFVELKLGKQNKSYYEQTKMQYKWQIQIEQTKYNEYLMLETRDEIDEFVESLVYNCRQFRIKNYFAFNMETKEYEK